MVAIQRLVLCLATFVYPAIFFFVLVHQHGWPGYFLGLLGFFLMHVYDALTGEQFWTNWATLQKNGFSTSTLVKIMVGNQVTGVLGPSMIIMYYADDIQYRFDLSLVLRVASCIALSDVCFYFSHRYLHRYMPEHHKLHHCCKIPSFTSNLLFDPLDLAIEFSGPVAIFIGGSLFVFQDPFAMLVGVTIMTTWYSLSHDDVIQGHHYRHHKYFDSTYAIYADVGKYDPLDKMKGFVKF